MLRIAMDARVRVEREPPIATVTLDRAEARNAIDRAMWAALPAIFAELAAARDVRVVGASWARDLLITGRVLDAREALAIGLLHRVVPLERVEAETRALALRIAEQAPLALRQAKANVDLIMRDPGLASVDRQEFA